MKRATRGVLGLVVLVAIAGLIGACGGSDDADSQGAATGGTVSDETIRIGASGSHSWLPIRYAAEQGYFSEEGLPNVEFVEIASAPDAANALAAGEIEFAGLAVERAVLSSLGGRATSCVMAIQDSPPSSLVVAADSGIDPGDWDALAGKTIGVVQGGWSEIFPKYLISQAGGISPDDVKWTSTANTGAMLSSLQAGQIDGFSGIEPAQRQAIEQGMAVMFYDLEDPENLAADWPEPFLATCLQAQREYADANPEVVAAVSAAIDRALKEIHDDHQIAIDLAASTAPDVPERVWEASVEGLITTWSTTGQIDEQAVANVQNMLVDFGILPRALPYEELVFTP
jgi:ABC-type nitrate/sulfonate/bicarbonate transport system substrate-binding protein